MTNISKKAEELRKQARRLELLGEIYDTLSNQMKWDVMKRTDETDENGDNIFVAPDPDDWTYEKYTVWLEVMGAIEKLAK